MTGADWINTALQAVVLIGAVLIIRADTAKLHRKLDKLAEVVTNMRLALKDCVTWEELNRELGPIRGRGEDHEKRLGRIETQCEARHGK